VRLTPLQLLCAAALTTTLGYAQNPDTGDADRRGLLYKLQSPGGTWGPARLFYFENNRHYREEKSRTCPPSGDVSYPDWDGCRTAVRFTLRSWRRSTTSAGFF
jgi:hypothetical protein